MSTSPTAPGGLSWSAFESMAADAGSWLWGTVQGAFNEKSSLSQIIVDAVIGMIPLVGDVTAVRDLIAVSIGMVDEPKRRDDVWQWVLLVVLLFALVPVIGGVVKGVGRLVIKAVGEAAHIAGQAQRAAHLAQSAKDIIAFLNRVGMGNAEKWLLKLKFAEHQAAILEKLNAFTLTIDKALAAIQKKLSGVLSAGMLRRIEALRKGMTDLAQKGVEMIPQAIKELDQKLREIQAYVRSGGQTTSRTIEHAVASGDKATVHYADELRLLEEGSGALRSRRGGWLQNAATSKDRAAIDKVYQHEAGYPDLLARTWADRTSGVITYTNITTYAGKITNRALHEGEQVFRVFGPPGVTHTVQIGKTYPTGPGLKFWGVGTPPKTAKEWRESAAVLDEWNHDGFIVTGRVVEEGKIKACTGKIAEQKGDKLGTQYLPGGAQQALLEMSPDGIKQLGEAGERVIAAGGAASEKVVVDGIEFTVRATGWKDVNGVWGYLHMPGPGAVQTVRLGAREQATKDEHRQPH